MHKFAIEYDFSDGTETVDPGADRCLGVYDTLDECEVNFSKHHDEVHSHWQSLPESKRRRTSYLIACYCWKVDEDGELTDEEAWNDLSDDEKERANNLSVAYEV